MEDISKYSVDTKIYPTETAQNVDVVYSDSASLRMHLKTPFMQRFSVRVKEPYMEMPKGLFVEFYDDSGKVKNRLKANYAIKYETRRLMEVKYKVEVTNVYGEKLETEQLVWDEANKKIRSEKFVKITTKKEILMGEGMEANEDFTEYEILKPRGSKIIEDESGK
jgi:LPS export ABC transporter protein LptC